MFLRITIGQTSSQYLLIKLRKSQRSSWSRMRPYPGKPPQVKSSMSQKCVCDTLKFLDSTAAQPSPLQPISQVSGMKRVLLHFKRMKNSTWKQFLLNNTPLCPEKLTSGAWCCLSGLWSKEIKPCYILERQNWTTEAHWQSPTGRDS